MTEGRVTYFEGKNKEIWNSKAFNNHQHEIVVGQLSLCSWQQTFPEVKTSTK